jgi:hypothetical protein
MFSTKTTKFLSAREREIESAIGLTFVFEKVGSPRYLRTCLKYILFLVVNFTCWLGDTG